MHFFAIGVIFQILLAIHCVKTGRDSKWLYFILLFPLVGGVVYFIAEVLPEFFGSSTGRRARKSLVNAIDPHRDLRNSADRLSISSNVHNVITFAEECANKKLYDEAINTYKDALKGIFENDPKLLLGLARAYFDKGEFQQAIATLDSLIEKNPDFKSADGHLLFACAHEALGEYDKAKEEFGALIQYFPGPEAKCRYALMLKKLGENDQAQRLFEDIKITARHSPHHYYKMHKHWIEIARKEVG